MSVPAVAQTTHFAETTDSPPATTEREVVTAYGTGRYERLIERIEAELDEEHLVTDTDTQGRSPETIAAGLVAILQSAQSAIGVRPTGRSIADVPAFAEVTDHTEDAYRRGVASARSDLRQAGMSSVDTSDAQLTQRLNQPGHQRSLDQLYRHQARKFTELADDVLEEVQSEVQQALREGADRRAVKQRVRDRVEKVGKNRATLIGETEPARAYHEATLSEYELLGVREVELDWNVVGDHRTCQRCFSGESGSPYQLEAARGLLPHHPRCRCWFSARKESVEGTRR